MKKSIGTKIFNAVNFIYLSLLSLAMFIPFIIVLSVSFSSENAVNKFGYTLWPHEFSVDAYKLIFESGTVFQAYGVSIFVTVVGTAIAVLITAMVGYAISRKYLRYRNVIALLFYFSMLFSGGLVPWYITVTQLGLKNTIWALIFPMCFAPFNMLLIRNFFQTLPDALVESAKLDGAGEMRIFFNIMLPLALPGLATITLFYMLGYWNDWWLALNFIDDAELFPLQYLLRKVLSNVLFAASGINQQISTGLIPSETTKMATCIVTIGPIIFVYPFIQKYFIKGITVGAVKG